MLPSCAQLDGFAIDARIALLWQHYENPWQSPAVIRPAHRTPHACCTRTLRMPAKTPLAVDKMDAPAACAVPFRPNCGRAVTRTRNVSEYMLVLGLCLVVCLFVFTVTARRCLFRFASDAPVSFVDNRRELMEALDRDGAPLRPRDIHLLEDEIQRAQQYVEQAERLRAASRRCGEGLPEFDDGITRDPVCNSSSSLLSSSSSSLLLLSQ